jgi:uncharacterized membrane protein YfcA
MYGMLRNLAPAALHGTLNAFFMANNIAIIGGLATSGILTISTSKLVLFCIPTMVLGSIVGQYVHKRISVKVFRIIVFLLPIASGAMLIKGAMGISALGALLPVFGLLVVLQLIFGKKGRPSLPQTKRRRRSHNGSHAIKKAAGFSGFFLTKSVSYSSFAPRIARRRSFSVR